MSEYQKKIQSIEIGNGILEIHKDKSNPTTSDVTTSAITSTQSGNLIYKEYTCDEDCSIRIEYHGNVNCNSALIRNSQYIDASTTSPCSNLGCFNAFECLKGDKVRLSYKSGSEPTDFKFIKITY